MKDTEKSKKIKSLFETYFDGCYEVDAQPNTSNTYTMGVCKLNFDEKDNMLSVYLRRPGLLIGEQGKIIDDLEKYLECKIKIVEITHF
jgi:ribosomal protein S3